MKHKVLAAAMAIGLTCSANASEVADFFAGMNTFSGNFSQTVYQDGQLVQQSTGTVALKKPLKFRWNYQSPEAMQLVSDGSKFYHYDIDLAQVTTKPIKEVAGTALASMLSDNQKIDETFSVAPVDISILQIEFPRYADQWGEKATTFYNLTPLVAEADDMKATRVILGFSADQRLTVFYAEDAYGQNAFLFDNVQQNTPISDSKFQFVAPAGVDVLGG